MNSKSSQEIPCSADSMRVVDNVIFVSGQVDRNSKGVINNAGDLNAQILAVVTRLEKRLEKESSELSDLVKLVVYYVQDHVAESVLRLRLGQCLGSSVQTTVTFVPLRQLRHAGALIEVESIAMTNGMVRQIATPEELAAPGVGFCHGLRCGNFTFVSGQCSESRDGSVLYRGDLVSQNQRTIDNLRCVLAALDVDSGDIVKVNSWRAPALDHDAYEQAAKNRFDFLAAAGPVVTGITIPRLGEVGHQIRLDLWAMDREQPRTRINPSDHWGWKTETSYSHGLLVGDWLFVGGQAALNQKCVVQYPEDFLSQLILTRTFIENVVRDAQGEFEFVHVNGMYCADPKSGSNRRLDHLLHDQFRETGAVTTMIPVDQLAYAHQKVEFDAIARRPG